MATGKANAIMIAAAMAVIASTKADTVVWYTFDNLGDVGTGIADSSTIQNKVNPGMHDATVYGIKQGYIKDPTSANLPYVTNGVPEFTRMWDPVSRVSASGTDRALRFPSTNAAGQGALLEVDTDASLRPEAFTAEALFRYPNPDWSLDANGWNRLVIMPNDAGYAWEIVVQWHDQIGFHFMANDGSVTNRSWSVKPASGNWNDCQWHHVALSVEQGETTSTVKMYLDYALMATKTLDYRISYSSSNLPLQIGARSEKSCLGNFCGELGEFRFSDAALVPAQFLRPRSTAARSDFDPDCVLYYDFEDDFTEDWSWFAAALGDVVNKADPGVMGGTFVEQNGLAPAIVEDSPVESLRQSMFNTTYEDSKKALRNYIASAESRTHGYLKCTPLDEDWLAKTNFTIETFFKTDNQSQTFTPLFQRNGGNNVQLKFGINGGNGDYLGINISTNTLEQVQQSWYKIPYDEWHHAALVVNQTGEDKKIDLYIDGLRKGGMTLATNLTSLDKPGMTHNGTWFFAGAGGYSFDCTIDSMRVTLRALKPAEFMTSRGWPQGSTITRLSFEDGTPNASAEFGTLCEGRYQGASGSEPTYPDDVPGVIIRDGEAGEVLTKHNLKSISFPDTTEYSWFAYGAISSVGKPMDVYYLHYDTNGVKRTVGTIEFWMKSNQTDADWDTVVLELYKSSGVAWMIRFNSTHTLQFEFGASDDDWKVVVASDVNVLDGKWHHVAFTYGPNAEDSTKMDAKAYVDYNYIATKTAKGHMNLDSTNDYFDFRLGGQRGHGHSEKNFGGLLDELRISDRVLEPSQFLRAENAPGFVIFVR